MTGQKKRGQKYVQLRMTQNWKKNRISHIIIGIKAFCIHPVAIKWIGNRKNNNDSIGRRMITYEVLVIMLGE